MLVCLVRQRSKLVICLDASTFNTVEETELWCSMNDFVYSGCCRSLRKGWANLGNGTGQIHSFLLHHTNRFGLSCWRKCYIPCLDLVRARSSTLRRQTYLGLRESVFGTFVRHRAGRWSV